jgi:hypothetical protein
LAEARQAAASALRDAAAFGRAEAEDRQAEAKDRQGAQALFQAADPGNAWERENPGHLNRGEVPVHRQERHRNAQRYRAAPAEWQMGSRSLMAAQLGAWVGARLRQAERVRRAELRVVRLAAKLQQALAVRAMALPARRLLAALVARPASRSRWEQEVQRPGEEAWAREQQVSEPQEQAAWQQPGPVQEPSARKASRQQGRHPWLRERVVSLSSEPGEQQAAPQVASGRLWLQPLWQSFPLRPWPRRRLLLRLACGNRLALSPPQPDRWSSSGFSFQ